MRIKSALRKPPKIDICRFLAKKQLEKILSTRNDIIAAYSDGSVARNDMVPGSDIDIGIVVKNPKEPKNVYRIIEKKNDILIEWAFIPKENYTLNNILSNAGFTHDIVNAFVYYDSEGFFENIKKEVLKNYKLKDGIIKRAANQLSLMKNLLTEIEAGDKKLIYKNTASFIKFSLGFPSALLNKPVTNSRGFIFCEDACKKLKMMEYRDLILEFLGSLNITKIDAKRFLGNARKIMKSGKLNNNESITYLYHLNTAEYLIETGFWREAIWPIFMWTSYVVYELEQRKGKDEIDIRKLWNEMLRIIEWKDSNDINKKIDSGKKMLKLGFKVLKTNTSLQSF